MPYYFYCVSFSSQYFLLLFLTWLPVHEVCLNHEVVMLQPQKGKSPELVYVAIINLFSILSSPPVTTVFWIFFFHPRTYILTPPYLSPFNTSSLSMLKPLIPPISIGRGANVHLDGTATRRPPLLISALPSLSRRTLELRAACLWLKCPSSVRPPLYHSRPVTISLSSPRGSTVQGSHTPSGFLRRPHIRSPPWRPQPSAQYLPIPRGFRSVLCMSLTLVHFPSPPCVPLRLLVSYGD